MCGCGLLLLKLTIGILSVVARGGVERLTFQSRQGRRRKGYEATLMLQLHSKNIISIAIYMQTYIT